MANLRNIGILVLFIAIVSIALIFLSKALIEAQKDYKRQTENLRIVQQDNKVIKAKNGELMYQTEVIKLENKELKNAIPELEAELKNMRIKLKNVQSVSHTSLSTIDTIYTNIYDTITLDNPIPDTLLGFQYSDEFTCIEGVINVAGQMLKLNYEVTDTITQVVHRDKWRLFHKRKLFQTITCRNPRTTIVYQQQIVITK